MRSPHDEHTPAWTIRRGAAWLLALTTAASCTAILGIDKDYTEVDVGSGGAGGTGGNGAGGGGAGGAGGGGEGGGGGATSSSGSGGGGGQGGEGPCNGCFTALMSNDPTNVCTMNGPPSSNDILQNLIACACFALCTNECRISGCAGRPFDMMCQDCALTNCSDEVSACVGDG